MRLDTCTKEWTRIDDLACICMIWIYTDIYKYGMDVAGNLRIETFAVVSITTARDHSTVTLSYTGACG